MPQAHRVKLEGFLTRKQAMMTGKVLKNLWPELEVKVAQYKVAPKRKVDGAPRRPTTVTIAAPVQAPRKRRKAPRRKA